MTRTNHSTVQFVQKGAETIQGNNWRDVVFRLLSAVSALPPFKETGTHSRQGSNHCHLTSRVPCISSDALTINLTVIPYDTCDLSSGRINHLIVKTV